MRRERQLLVDHRHTRAASLDRASWRVLLPGDRHRPLVRLDGARENPHQGALAGAVLADEAADLAGPNREVDAIERDRRPETLRDAAHLEERARLCYFSH